MGPLWIALKSRILWVGFATAVVFSAILALLAVSARPPSGTPGTAIFEAPLASAAVAIFATGFLGGILKIILDVIGVEREGRSDRIRFLQNTLDDVKAVEDRLQRARVIILAHRSVKTYGDEMRDIIDARVKLKNIERAYRLTALDFPEAFRNAIRTEATAIISGCNPLIEEFQAKYKTLADSQRVHEAILSKLLDGLDQTKGIYHTKNRDDAVWALLMNLPKLQEFLPSNLTSYEERIGCRVDEMTRMLRDAMQATREGRTPT